MINAPSDGAPEKAPRWDLLGTEGCGGGNRVSVGERSNFKKIPTRTLDHGDA